MGNVNLVVVPTQPRVVDGTSFPFTESRYVSGATGWGMLQFEVITIYESYADRAEVFVNNTSIGKIDPRPYSRYQDLQLVTIVFSTTAFHPTPPTTGSHTISIRPVSADKWLIVGNWWLLHHAA